jgi:hypothetical protein
LLKSAFAQEQALADGTLYPQIATTAFPTLYKVHTVLLASTSLMRTSPFFDVSKHKAIERAVTTCPPVTVQQGE